MKTITTRSRSHERLRRTVRVFWTLCLSPEARVLSKGGVPVALGSRALDILITLVERAGEVVSQRELMSRAWLDLVVEPGNLGVQMTNVRRYRTRGVPICSFPK